MDQILGTSDSSDIDEARIYDEETPEHTNILKSSKSDIPYSIATLGFGLLIFIGLSTYNIFHFIRFFRLDQ